MANDVNPLRSARNVLGLVARSPRLAWAELRDRRRFNEVLFEVFAGMPEDRVLVLADEAFEWCMRKHIYPGARDLVRRSQDLGHEVVLVSGALDFLLAKLAEHLGADHYVGNRLEMKDGYATGQLLRPVIAGPTKSRVIYDHAVANGHDLSECFGYSDSYSDVPMLSVVGKPAVINPDSKLRRLARAHQWPIIKLEPAR
jgi:HAD superfamily hydrolase (TIGR01490 family)